jgi:hypothetical protein
MRRQARGTTTQGWNFSFAPEFLDWRAPKGVRIPSRRQLLRAMDAVPSRIDWDWAVGKLLPVLERPGSEPFPDNPYLSTSAECGVAFGFGISQGPILMRVNQGIADQWESSIDQIREAAFENLRSLTAGLGQSDLIQAADESLVLTAIAKPEGYATSLLLIPDELQRLFGTEDQVFTTPSRGLLMSFPIDTDVETVVAFTTHFEDLDPHPLLLDPFVLERGELRFEGADP